MGKEKTMNPMITENLQVYLRRLIGTHLPPKAIEDEKSREDISSPGKPSRMNSPEKKRKGNRP